MTSSQIATVCAEASRMAQTRSDLVEWVAANRETIERALPAHAAGIIEGAREHWRGLAR
jgi:hypothetical protein